MGSHVSSQPSPVLVLRIISTHQGENNRVLLQNLGTKKQGFPAMFPEIQIKSSIDPLTLGMNKTGGSRRIVYHSNEQKSCLNQQKWIQCDKKDLTMLNQKLGFTQLV
jgi:hypothetical protein